MTRLHIYAPACYYLAQVRGYGCRKWRSLPGKYKSGQAAIIGAIRVMRQGDKRSRVMMIARSGYLDPVVVMECRR